MESKRLERFNNKVRIYLGKEDSRARQYFAYADRDRGHAVPNKWADAFYVIEPDTRYSTFPAADYFRNLQRVIASVESFNHKEQANMMLYGEPDYISIDEEVYALRDKFADILEKTYKRLEERIKVAHEAIVRANHIEYEYNREIVHKTLSRRELLQDLQYGRLAETAENKTLYEMYDDGYRWQA